MEMLTDYGLADMTFKTQEKIIPEGVVPDEALKGEAAASSVVQTDITSITVQEALLAALKSFGFKPTEENLKLAALLLEAQLPVNKENLAKLNQSMKLTGGEDAKALFLIENGLRPNLKNAAILTQLIQGEGGLGEEMKNLLQAVEQMESPEIKEILREIFSADQTAVPPDTSELPVHEAPVRQEDAPISANAQENDIPKEEAPVKDIPAKDVPAKDVLTEGVPVKDAPVKDAAAGNVSENDMLAKDSPVKDIPVKDTSSKDIPAKDIPMKEASENDRPIKNIQVKAIPVEELLAKDVKTKDIPVKEQSKTFKDGRIYFSPRGKDPKEIDEYLSGLKEKLTQATEKLAGHDSPEAAKVLKQISNIEERIEFIAQMKNDVFVQLPLSIHNHETNGELFVFKDKRNKRRSQGAVSALVALDTAYLGRFEVYVRKDGRNVNCQFRLAGKQVEKMVRENMEKLSELLKQHNYALEMFSFKKLEEPFTLLNKEPLPDESGSGLQKSNGTGRISFDIRT